MSANLNNQNKIVKHMRQSNKAYATMDQAWLYSGQNPIKNCAGKFLVTMYFQRTSSANLKSAFKYIARKIIEVHQPNPMRQCMKA